MAQTKCVSVTPPWVFASCALSSLGARKAPSWEWHLETYSPIPIPHLELLKPAQLGHTWVLFLFPSSEACSGRPRRQQGGVLAVWAAEFQLFSWLAGRGEGKQPDTEHFLLLTTHTLFHVCPQQLSQWVLSVANEVLPLPGQPFTWAFHFVQASLQSVSTFPKSAAFCGLTWFGIISGWDAEPPWRSEAATFQDASPRLIQKRNPGRHFKALSYQVESKQCGFVSHT